MTITPCQVCDEQLHVIIHREWDGERKKWAAQCLEHDIAAQGETLDDVTQSFARIVSGYIELGLKHGRNPLSHLRPAPAGYHRMWDKATKI